MLFILLVWKRLICVVLNNENFIFHSIQAHLYISFGNHITYTELNISGTHSVLEATQIYGKIKKCIYISSDEVYDERVSES